MKKETERAQKALQRINERIDELCDIDKSRIGDNGAGYNAVTLNALANAYANRKIAEEEYYILLLRNLGYTQKQVEEWLEIACFKGRVASGLSKGLKILIIDDEEGVADIFNARFGENDCKIIPAYSGEEGLKKAIEEKPSIIFLDIVMPNMDGLTVLSRLKRTSETSHIPVVMLTAKGDTSYLFETKRLGSMDYIIKPIKFTEIQKAIDKYAIFQTY